MRLSLFSVVEPRPQRTGHRGRTVRSLWLETMKNTPCYCTSTVQVLVQVCTYFYKCYSTSSWQVRGRRSRGVPAWSLVRDPGLHHGFYKYSTPYLYYSSCTVLQPRYVQYCTVLYLYKYCTVQKYRYSTVLCCGTVQVQEVPVGYCMCWFLSGNVAFAVKCTKHII